MKILFSDHSWEDYLYWQKTDKKMLIRVNELIKDIQRNKYQGLGKPEPLKHNLSGYWSRRINSEHRLVCKIEKDIIYIAQLRYHYLKRVLNSNYYIEVTLTHRSTVVNFYIFLYLLLSYTNELVQEQVEI